MKIMSKQSSGENLHQDAERQLHICNGCESDLVQLIDWGEPKNGFWELVLKCPECDQVDEGFYGRKEVQALEEKLDAGLTEVLYDLRQLYLSNMEEWIGSFTEALQIDLILPEDF